MNLIEKMGIKWYNVLKGVMAISDGEANKLILRTMTIVRGCKYSGKSVLYDTGKYAVKICNLGDFSQKNALFKNPKAYYA